MYGIVTVFQHKSAFQCKCKLKLCGMNEDVCICLIIKKKILIHVLTSEKLLLSDIRLNSALFSWYGFILFFKNTFVNWKHGFVYILDDLAFAAYSLPQSINSFDHLENWIIILFILKGRVTGTLCKMYIFIIIGVL